MIWTIGVVMLAIFMLIVMSKRVEVDDDPVFQTVLAVDRLGDEIARWETNLWSLWVMAVVENLLMRLDESDKVRYLNKLEIQIIELRRELYKQRSKSEKGPVFPCFEQETTDLQTH